MAVALGGTPGHSRGPGPAASGQCNAAGGDGGADYWTKTMRQHPVGVRPAAAPREHRRPCAAAAPPHLTRCLVQLREDANEQDLANALYALGRLHEQCRHVPPPEHLQGLAAWVLQRLSMRPTSPDTSTPQAVSNMLWSCAKLRYAHPELLTRLAGAAEQAAGRMEEQELSNSCWAMGRLVEAGCLDGSRGVPGVQRLAEEVGRRVRGRQGGFTPQHLSNTLLGLAHLQSAAQPGAYKLGSVVKALAAECHLG